MMDANYTRLIERYFDQLLSEEELAEFEQLKESDADFRKELELFEMSHKVVEISALLELKEEVKGIHHKIDKSGPVKILSIRWVGIAASVLFVIGLGIYSQQFSNQNLYDTAYSPVADYVTNMDNDLSDMEKAMRLLNEQEYEQAGKAFHKIFGSSGSQEALFYEGHCYYQADRLEQAIDILKNVTGSYKPEAQWYVALAYLKLDEVLKTNEVLNSIIENGKDEKFVIKAKELNRKLSHPLRRLVF